MASGSAHRNFLAVLVASVILDAGAAGQNKPSEAHLDSVTNRSGRAYRAAGSPAHRHLSGKGNSFIVLGDSNGKDRVVFSVNKNDEVEIKLLDADGHMVFREPH